MASLPFNNLDEQLARFASASKKSAHSSANITNTKQFTFKKTLSLGKRTTSTNSDVPLQSIERKAILSTTKNNCPKTSLQNNNSKASLKKQTITNFFSKSNSKPQETLTEKDENFHNSFFQDDIFLSDIDDFEIPFSRKSSTELSANKTPVEVNSSVNPTKVNDSNKGITKTSTNSDSIEIFMSDDELLFTDDEKDILPVSSKRKSVQKIISDDESINDDEFNTIEMKKSKKTHQSNEVPLCDNMKEIRSFEQSSLLEENNLTDINEADIPSVLNSLQNMNMKIMTEICDFLETNKGCFGKHEKLNYLLNIRKKVLKQSLLTEQLSTSQESSKESITLSKIKQEPGSPKKVKPCSLFRSNTSKSKEFSNLHFETTHNWSHSSLSPAARNIKCELDSFEPCNNSVLKNSSTPLPHTSNYSEYPKNTPSCRDVKSAFLSDLSPSSFRTSVSSPSNHAVKREAKYCPSVSNNHNSIDNVSIKIENIETQDILADQSIFDINDQFSAELINETSLKNESLSSNKDQIIAGKFYGNQRDDGASPEFKGFNFLFSKDVINIFHNIFGLKVFRHNQLETINAALLKEDCFVLMPTGGGKSLCYQLPALVNNGVTIVVSPLRSLIMDQVQKLCSLDIPAYSLTGDTDTSTSNHVYVQLASREPGIKLLYVTPEKISASIKLKSCLENLYSRNMIQRFVIDEAHCVSQWGHDFRPDYKRLSVLRVNFPKVPIMALTATATQRVRMDILHQLGMGSPKWFLQSFNRPNLKYEVRHKTKAVVKDIIELIKSKFKNMSGIVYCLSRNDCDAVAGELFKSGIKSAAYHAGINNREEVQEAWINDKFKVICATIAFGMGIDKPDVRFVIHHSMPKSIEGYYQESGRAGRDGEISWCILFYCYKDMHRLKRMMMKDVDNKHSWATHFDNLFRMVHYCENKTDCRRVWMLAYFGEIFERQLCLNDPRTSCDNCFSKEIFEMRDMTADAKLIIQCVAAVVDHKSRKNFTMPYFVDIYKGAKPQKIIAAGHDKLELHGKGKYLNRSDAERLFRKMVLDQYLQEELFINTMDLAISYLYLGKKARDLIAGNGKVVMPFLKGTKHKNPTVAAALPVEDKEILQLIESCYNELIEVSKAIAAERNLHYTNVVNVEALRKMSREMPMTEEDMLLIPHITRAVYEKYGKRFLEVTTRYAAERCVIDAEKADKDMLSAMTEDIDNWSDAEPPPQGFKKRGQKRKQSAKATQSKKQKGYFRKKKYAKGKAKNHFSASQQNKYKAAKTKSGPSTSRAPGILPMPKTTGKVVSRSFLSVPKLTYM